MLGDTELQGVSHVVVDEVHERSLESDFLLMVLRDLMNKPRAGGPIKIVLMSATINADLFSTYFGGVEKCPIIEIPGRSHPVEGLYLEDALERTRYVVEPNSDYALPRSKQGKPGKLKGPKGNSTPGEADDAGGQDFMQSEAALQLRYKGYSKWTINALRACDYQKVNLDLALLLLVWICEQEMTQEVPGAVLVFLPGYAEISRLFTDVTTHPFFADGPQQWNGKTWGGQSKFMVLPLHSSLSGDEQARVFITPPKGTMKLVLSTNIAETSITIDDCVWVVDGGRMKETQYDATKKMASLEDAFISRANGLQRRGRAGRVKPGKCFHLLSSHRWEKIAAHQTPEIFRVPLDQISLRIKTLAFMERDAEAFHKAQDAQESAAAGSSAVNKPKVVRHGVMAVLARVIEPPKIKAIKSSLDTLQNLDALDKNEKLTSLGHYLAFLPVDCRIGKLILFGCMFGCCDSILTIAAGLSYRSPFVAPFGKLDEANIQKAKFACESSDHLTILAAYQAYMRAGSKYGDKKRFCGEHFLSMTTLTMLGDLKRQYAELLSEIGFITPPVTARKMEFNARKAARSSQGNSDGILESIDAHLNANNGNMALLKVRGGDISPPYQAGEVLSGRQWVRCMSVFLVLGN